MSIWKAFKPILNFILIKYNPMAKAGDTPFSAGSKMKLKPD